MRAIGNGTLGKARPAWLLVVPADDLHRGQECVVSCLRCDQVERNALRLAEDAQERHAPRSTAGLHAPCLAAVASVQNGAQRADGPAAKFVDEGERA
jgi:hypothetical protein